MNHNHMLSLLQTGFTTIHVTFDVNMTAETDPTQRARNRNVRQQTYTYKALLTDDVKVDDHVIVESPHNGLTVVKVVEVDATPKIDLSAPFPYKWIVQKIDRSRYDDLLKQEQNFNDALVEVERVRAREEVMKNFQQHLPEGSEARKLFDTTITSVKELPHAG